MSLSSTIYIGPYLQLLEKKVGFDLYEFLVEENNESLSEVPSECFDVNYTLVVSNQGKLGRFIDCEYGGAVVETAKLNPEEEMKKFQNKHSTLIKVLEANYQKVILKHGIIYYTR